MKPVPRRAAALFVAVLGFAPAGQRAAAQTPPEHTRLGRELLKELIETNTTHSTGSTTVAAEKLAARFVAAGFPKADVVVVHGTSKAAADRGNLVVRYRGSGRRKPVLFIAHLDVVEARREDWSLDPFVLTEKDGYFYGRGTIDVKGGAATLAAAFLRLRQESFVPDRDLILALTADEEGGDDNGIEWLLANRRELIDAAYAMNVDSGGGEIVGGKLVVLEVEAAEKVFASFTLTVKNPGGHSSLPTKDNAIHRLAAGLQRLAAFEFPVHLTEVTRGYFDKMAPLSGKNAADMTAVARATPDAAAAARLSATSAFHNALLRTTCVPTLLQGGHAENALPQTAQATVNCRIIPGEEAAAVQATLVRVLADPQIAVAPIKPATPSPPSPLAAEPLSAIESAARAAWGAAPVVPIAPFMDTGATDGLFLRTAGIPVYGTTGIAYDPDDYRAHGKDERILVKSFDEGLVFAYQLAKAIGTAAAPGSVLAAQDRSTVPASAASGFHELLLHDPCTAPNAAQPDTCLHERLVEKRFTFGGTPGVIHDVRLRIRGLFEPTTIAGGNAPDPDHPYFTVGGTIAAGEWSAWHIEVSEPRQTYWLNHYPKVSHTIYAEDFEATIPIAGGSGVVVRVVDGNDRQIDNGAAGRPDRRQIIAGVLDGPLDGQVLRLDVVGVTAHAPVLRVRDDGRLDVSAPPPGTVIRYTLDGTAPTRDAGEWLAPVEAPPGYIVKARAFAPDGAPVGDVATWSAAPAATRTASTLVPVTQNRDWRVYDWTARHAAASALMQTRQPEIVMLGDSITHFWGGEPEGGRRTGADEWDRFFAGRRVVNLGYGWDRTENVLWRLTHGEFEAVSPKVVVTMIGTNNVTINTTDEIAAGIDAICAEIHRRSPATKILLLAIFPRGATPDPIRAKVTEINQRIARLDGRNGVTFLDIGEKFLAADGSIATDVMYDYLHPTAKGYAIWSAAMAPTLERLLR